MKRVLIVIAIIAAVSIACCGASSMNEGQKIGESESATSAPAELEVYGIGDIIKVQDHTIVLNSAEFSGNMLKANFTIENLGDDEINVSSMLSFEARDDEGTELDQEYFDCGSELGGSVLPGDKLKGDICWSGATTDIVRIYYEANIWSGGAIVWEVSK